MPLHITHRELANSSAQLRKAADAIPEQGQPSHLLRFYSVECGLKAVALRRRGLQRERQLPEDLLTHDLRRLAVELRLNQRTYRDLVNCQRLARGKKDSGPPVQVRQLHEAWRYGARLDPQDEQRCVAGLTALGDRCREELGQ